MGDADLVCAVKALGGVAPLILNLSTRFSFHLHVAATLPQGTVPGTHRVGPRAFWEFWRREKSVAAVGIRSRDGWSVVTVTGL